MSKIDYSSDKSGGLEEARGSDSRLNVSSRSDSRSYYNSRDEAQAYSVPFAMADAAVGEFVVYWRNTSSDRKLVIDAIGFNAIENAHAILHYVSGTAAGGNELTPTNLNKSSSNAAPSDSTVSAMEGGAAATGITGLTSISVIDRANVQANGHEEFRLADRLRLGQNDAIAIEYDVGTTGNFSGVVFGFYET